MNDDAPQERDMTIREVLELATKAQQQGQVDEAMELHRRILEAWPECADALHFSGLICFKRGDVDEAIARIERSLRLEPRHPDFWNNFGNVLKAEGKHDDARNAYGNAVLLRPDFADAHNNLGVMASMRGDLEQAVAAYEKAIAFQPKHADALLNLGCALSKLERLSEGVAAYEKVIALRPADPEAYGRLGAILWKQGRIQEATDVIVRSTEIAPGDPMAFIVLAGVFFGQGRMTESIEAYRKAVELDPTDPSANSLLALALNHEGRADEAKQVWKNWSNADPDNPVPRHHYAAGSDETIPARAADDFVVRVFDRFAETFDSKLKTLEYRAPELVTEALSQVIREPNAGLDILDAGCGTGLCAPLIRPYARRLEGVDLSAAMLEKARARGGYDSLTAAELTAFVRERTGAYDVIVSADTLCYFGHLESVFSAAHGALRERGIFIFTVEKTVTSTGATGVTLDQSGRYTHTESYVRSALANAAFSVLKITYSTLRLEFFKPVEGMVVVARKE